MPVEEAPHRARCDTQVTFLLKMLRDLNKGNIRPVVHKREDILGMGFNAIGAVIPTLSV